MKSVWEFEFLSFKYFLLITIPVMHPAHPLMGPAKSKESAWERGLKVSKRIREEVKRNEKSDEESDDSSLPGMRVNIPP